MTERRTAPTFGAVVLACLVLAGFLAGSGRLADNSFLTHLATGRLFWSGGGLPHEDPYTFTAAGEPWVVQSWLASVIYGGIEELTSLAGVRVLMALTTALLAGLLWVLSERAGSLTARMVLVLPALLLGFDGWAERPFLLGLLAMGLLLLALDGRLGAPWLVPVMWIWVNTHGSWPLGLVAIGAVSVGRALDGDDLRPGLRCLRWSCVGLLTSVVNPYGVEILTFPFGLLRRREALSGIKEWQRAELADVGTLSVLLLALVVAAGLARGWRWGAAVPSVVFLAAGLLAARNLLVASMVLVSTGAPVLAGFGTISTSERRPSHRAALAAIAAVGVVLLVVTGRSGAVDDRQYPVAADRFLTANQLDPRTHRIVAREFVGNWFEARYGPTGMVYVDDRAEVLPLEVIEEHLRLLGGAGDWESILERAEADAVLWQVDEELHDLVGSDDDWQVVYEDEAWFVAVPVS